MVDQNQLYPLEVVSRYRDPQLQVGNECSIKDACHILVLCHLMEAYNCKKPTVAA